MGAIYTKNNINNNVIRIGRWTLLSRVVNDGTDKWPDYVTRLFLKHIHMPADTVLDIARSNKLYITNCYDIIDDTVSTVYNTQHDKRIDTIPDDVTVANGITPRIRDDIEYITRFCTHNQY